MPIWPTKLLPAITSARLVVVASPTAARDDRCALSSTNYQLYELKSKYGSLNCEVCVSINLAPPSALT